MKDFRDKVAVVTGGANGVGRGLVEALLDEGARVLIADIEQPVLDATLQELDGRGEVSGILLISPTKTRCARSPTPSSSVMEPATRSSITLALRRVVADFLGSRKRTTGSGVFQSMS